MSNLFDLSIDDFVDVKSHSQTHHSYDGQIANNSIFFVEEDEDEREDKYLHIVLQIPSPRDTHGLSIVNEVVYKEYGSPSSLAIRNLT